MPTKLVLLALVATLHIYPIDAAVLSFRSHLAVSLANNGTSFVASTEEIPGDLLLADKKTTKKKVRKSLNSSEMVVEDLVMCSQSSEAAYDGEIDVLLLFSKCIGDSTLATVATWARDMKKIVDDTVDAYAGVALNFKASMVPGACTNDVQEVTTDDLDRVATHPGLSDVYALESVLSSTDSFTAVLSFATDATSYNAIVSFENVNDLGNVVNFQLSGSSDNCEGGPTSCIELKQDDDIFMYNPFTVTQSLDCADLENGVPVTLLGDDGTRQCYCGCPAGFEMQTRGREKTCVKVNNSASTGICVWSKVNGYKHQVTSPYSVCSFDHVVDKWGIPLPLPTSGYGLSKLLLLSDASLDPRVRVAAIKIQNPEYYAGFLSPILGSVTSLWPLKFSDVVARAANAAKFDPMIPGGGDLPIHDAAKTWKDYQSNRADAVNSIVFKDFGKYRLEMDAYDYYSSATCSGCLVILDKYRPRATSQCPTSFCDYGANCCTAELTADSVAKANDLVQQYFNYGDQAENDGCSGNNRCDLHQFSKRNFFESKYTKYSHDEAISCFDHDAVLGEILNHKKITVNPLKQPDGLSSDAIAPVPTGQCTRCCSMSTALREFWTDYRCGSDYDARYCEGDSDQMCTFEQCLVVNGDTLATVTAHVKPVVVAESEKVLQKLHEEDAQTVTQIHRALECTSYYGNDGVCDYMAKLSELIETTQSLNFEGDFKVNNYVYWRFKVNGESEKWQLWKTRRQTSAETGCQWATCEAVYDDDPVLTFSDPETKISIEAWTQCGLVRRFFFYVHLHVNSAVDVCKHFDTMWYQTSVSRLPIAAQMCAYPGSDFAELTFDFHPKLGLQYSRTELQMKVTEVVCSGALENRTSVEILKVSKDSPEIVTRFGVELLHTPSTEAITNFDVSCDFKYVGYGDVLHIKTCSRSFSIADCKGPQFDVPSAKCEYDKCAGKDKAGLYEACEGNIVKGSKASTYMESRVKECCQGCSDTKVVCTSLLDVPNATNELMRCEYFEKDLKFKSNVAFFGNAKVVNGESKIQLSDTGRVIYKKPIKLFQGKPKQLVSFSTYFTFSISLESGLESGGGLAFVMIPDGAKGVRNVKGDFFNETSSGFSLGFKSNDFEVVGVEFSVSRDGKNEILIRNGVSSKIYVTNLVLTSGEKMHTWIDYEASSMRLEVRLSKNGNSKPFDPLLWDKIETSNVLKDEEMFVGFSPVKETSAFLYSWSFVLRHFPPHSMHSEPLDPKVFVKNSENPMVVESKEKGKSDCFLRVLAAMIFGTGCGALTAFSVLYLWTIFGNKRGAVVPEGCVMQGLDGDYRKVKIVVDNKTIGDGNK